MPQCLYPSILSHVFCEDQARHSTTWLPRVLAKAYLCARFPSLCVCLQVCVRFPQPCIDSPCIAAVLGCEVVGASLSGTAVAWFVWGLYDSGTSHSTTTAASLVPPVKVTLACVAVSGAGCGHWSTGTQRTWGRLAAGGQLLTSSSWVAGNRPCTRATYSFSQLRS